MMPQVMVSAIGSVAAVGLIILAWVHIRPMLETVDRHARRATFGLLLAGAIITSVMMRFEVSAGIVFDLTFALVALVALLGGPVAIASSALALLCFQTFVPVLDVAGLAGLFAVGYAGFFFAGGRRGSRSAVTIVGLTVGFAAFWRGANLAGFDPALVFGLAIPNMLAFWAAVAAMKYGQRAATKKHLLTIARENAPNFQYVKDIDSRFVAVNRAVANLHGFDTPQQMRGKSDFDIAPKAHADDLFDEEQKIMASKISVLDREERIVEANGSEHWYLTSKVPIQNPSGEVIGLAGVTHDITARKLLEREVEENRNLLSYALAEMSDGLALFNAEFEKEFSNEQFEHCYGAPTDRLSDEPEWAEELQSVFRTLSSPQKSKKNRLAEHSWEFELADGRWLKARVRQTENGSFLVMVADISREKHVDRLKDQFVATISHELRTPLTSIRGSLGLLQAKSAATLDEKSRRLLNISTENCERLSRLVDDMVDVEKIASGRMNYALEVIDIGALVLETVTEHGRRASMDGIAIDLTPVARPQLVQVDPWRLKRAIGKILTNAVKFSADSKLVSVKITSVVDQVAIEITDRGIGISDDYRSQIFQKFSQADGTSTRRSDGSGLGLNIARAIIEAFDGTIDFQSTPGVETTFRISLPLAEARVVSEEAKSVAG